MYKYILFLKNESDWILHANTILKKTDNITSEILKKILTFPFEFDSTPILQ